MPGNRVVVASVLGCIGLAFVAWGYWPLQYANQRVTVDIAGLGGVTSDATTGASESVRAELAPIAVSLAYPRWVRVGDYATIRLRIASQAVPPMVGAGPGSAGDDGLATNTGVPAGGNAWIQARLDLTGMVISPSGDITSPWSPGSGVNFAWRARAASPRRSSGTAWTFWLPEDSERLEGSRDALAAQPLQITATTVLGMSGPTIRILGACTMLVATAIGIPATDDLLRQRRRRGRPAV